MVSTLRVSSKLVKHSYQGSVSYSHWCPACECAHTFRISGPGTVWGFNDDLVNPSFNPSMRLFKPAYKGQPETTICHYFLTAGVIQYCGDTPGEYASQNVALPDIPSDYGFGGTAFADLPESD